MIVEPRDCVNGYEAVELFDGFCEACSSRCVGCKYCPPDPTGWRKKTARKTEVGVYDVQFQVPLKKSREVKA